MTQINGGLVSYIEGEPHISLFRGFFSTFEPSLATWNENFEMSYRNWGLSDQSITLWFIIGSFGYFTAYFTAYFSLNVRSNMALRPLGLKANNCATRLAILRGRLSANSSVSCKSLFSGVSKQAMLTVPRSCLHAQSCDWGDFRRQLDHCAIADCLYASSSLTFVSHVH